MPPILDPAEEAHITWAGSKVHSNGEWPQGPMKWEPGEDGTLVAIAVGSVKGKERREVVATLNPNDKEQGFNGQT